MSNATADHSQTDDEDPVIVEAEIGPYPRPKPQGLFDDMPTVTATFGNGRTEDLFQFYPDEIDFTEEELVGCTRQEALQLKQKKDREYLSS